MTRGYFITGTDTEVGKTIVTAALIHAFAERGEKVTGMKPIATGCIQTDSGLHNEDADLLMQYSSVEIPYAQVNPYAYEPAVSPHLAAKKHGESIDFGKIMTVVDQVREQTDWLIVEGIGGWQVPLNDTQTVADLAREVNYPVILVVGTRLGCISHALLTMESIQRSGLEIGGWVANIMDRNVNFLPDVIDTLRLRLNVPLVGIVPPFKLVNPKKVSEHLSIDRLIDVGG